MKYVATIGLVVVSLLGSASTLSAQSLLERLEKRLGNLAERAAESSRQPAGADELSQPGEGEPGYLGVIVDDREDGGQGVRVLSVKPDSGAAQAGIRDGDVIRSVNGQPIRDLADMARQLDGAAAGAKVPFQLLRGDQPLNVVVTLGRRAEAEDAAGAPAPARDEGAGPPGPSLLERELAGAADSSRPSLGVTVTNVSDAARQRYGINVARGALVTSVRSGSPADRAAIPLGAVIVSVDGKRVDSPQDLQEALGGAAVDEPLEVAWYQQDRLVRKTVELRESTDVSPPALPRLDPNSPPEPALRLGDARDRPLLGRLERALEGFVQPPEGAPPAPEGEVGRLRAEVEALRRHVGRLEERLEALEQRLNGNGPSPRDNR